MYHTIISCSTSSSLNSIETEPDPYRPGARGGVNLAGKVRNLFLVTIDVYRLKNRKIEVLRVFGGGGDPWGVLLSFVS